MEKDEVINTIAYLRKYRTETDRIEVKTAKGGFPKKCYDTISSFSNKYGGIIIFGLSESNGFVTEGVYDLNDLQKQISSVCSDAMIPAVRADILPLEFEQKNILAVKIEEILQNKKPCYYRPKGLKQGAFTRIGDRDEVMTDYEIYALQSYNDHIFEDRRPNKRASLDDLNKEELVNYIEKVKIEKPKFAKNTYEKCLRLCAIADNNNDQIYPTLAGTVIFAEYPQAFYPQLFVACVVVPGNELGDVGPRGERFIDNKRIDGTIEDMLTGTMNFLRRNMKISVTIDSDGKRTDKTEYPMEALREAIANALIHRDYSTQTENAYISVNMYDDRIEILNPGTLYGTNKLEKLGTATTMEARNPNIVRILEEKGSVIENRHSGIPTMKREMKKYGLPDPEFYEERDSFKVVFRNSSAQSDTQSGAQSDTQNHIDSQSVIEKVLTYCNAPKTAKEIREYIGMSSKSYVALNIIRPLIEKGLLDLTNKNSINARNQKYVTIKKNNNN